MLFNASKAYVRQLGKSIDYDLLQPVYSLNLVNDTFEPDMEQYYHYYRMVHYERTDKVIDGLHLIFIELPKFQPHNYKEKKMQVLWLRFLTEISEQTRNAPQELLDNPEVNKALTEGNWKATTSSGTPSAWNAPWSTARCAVTRKAKQKVLRKEGKKDLRKEGKKDLRKEGKKDLRKEGKKVLRKEGKKVLRKELQKELQKELRKDLRKAKSKSG